MTDTSMHDTAQIGLDIRHRMFGAEATDPQVSGDDPLTAKLQELVTEACFGEIWSREPLSLRDRSLATVAMLAALGRGPELRTHLRGALANGVAPDELREVMIHSYLYAGLPAAFGGVSALGDVLTDEEKGQLS
ncbi:MAG: carboxymuconolactone decarboxylase family protein [Pseudoclavibacter sp.]